MLAARNGVLTIVAMRSLRSLAAVPIDGCEEPLELFSAAWLMTDGTSIPGMFEFFDFTVENHPCAEDVGFVKAPENTNARSS